MLKHAAQTSGTLRREVRDRLRVKAPARTASAGVGFRILSR